MATNVGSANESGFQNVNTKKVLVTGASGLLGRAVTNEFDKNSWLVLGFAFSRPTRTLIKVDLNDYQLVSKVVKDFKPNAIVHCAAERSPDRVERDFETSQKLNTYSSRMLAELAGIVKAVFVYISSDYVFDGKNAPYAEFDEPNPINLYGLTKYDGETEVLKVNPDSCILRIPVLYGGEEFIRESAVSSLILNLWDKRPCAVSNYETRFPSHTNDIAKVVFQLVVKKLEDGKMSSVFHWCGSEPLTKYEMVKTIAEVFSVSHSHITPDDEPSPGVARPRNTELSCGRLRSLGIGDHTVFSDGVRESFAKFFGKKH